jgi:iron complex outermembrane recepter protein
MDTPARKWAIAIAVIALIAHLTPGYAAERTAQYDLAITKGSIVSVLEQFSQTTGLQVITELNVSESRVTEFGPLEARTTADGAMEALFRGTDLWYSWQDEYTIIIFRTSPQRVRWAGVSTAKEASDSIRSQTGVHYDPEQCGNLLIGPLETDAKLTAEELWIELIKPHCSIVKKRLDEVDPGSIDRPTVAGQTEHNFSIPEAARWRVLRFISEQAGGLPIFYLPSDADEEGALVGPIQGSMPVNAALKLATRDSALRVRWSDDNIASVEPAYRIVAYADMSVCPCNFGFPEFWPLQHRHVTVERSRLPSLDELITSPVFVGDREWIASTGATTIPGLFRYIPQIAFHHGVGYLTSGAQFFGGGRGVDAKYPLVLVNGRRAYGSAADPMVSAFDLNSIPLPAVERIEISFDQPSAAHGSDAIGGTVNIILKQRQSGISGDALVGSAEGGATQRRGTLSAGHDWGRVQGGAVIDYFTTKQLLGADRERWRNQDFRRYGGTDQRSRFAGNVRAISGNLPGLNSPTAAIVPGGGDPPVDTSTQNLTSLRAFQAVVPESERVSLYGFASADVGEDASVSAETLLGRRSVQYQLFPTLIPGLIWGADHHENPFDQDVLIETALTGFPIQTYNTDSELVRGVVECDFSLRGWSFNAFGLAQRDESRIELKNSMDVFALMSALRASGDQALSITSRRPGEGTDPRRLLAPRQIDRLSSGAQQVGLSLSGALGTLNAQIGLEHRREFATFDSQVGARDRNVSSAFAQLRTPLFVKSLELSIGARHDSYSDVAGVTRPTYALSWHPVPGLNVAASASALYRPPSLYEIHRPLIATPTQIFDPARNELAPVVIAFGGNGDLKSTDGRSYSLSISWESGPWQASANLWQLDLQDRLSAPSAPILLATDGHLARDRVSRDPAGKLVSIDLSYANYGEIHARGLDMALKREFNTPIGLLDVRLDVTRTFAFEYADLPISNAPLLDRVGQAALEGTVPQDRAVLSARYSSGPWKSAIFARYHSSVDDYSVSTGSPLAREIASQTLIDIQASRAFGDAIEISLGAENVLDDQPPFAQGFGDLGFDQGQGDLRGRFAYFKVSASF